MIELPDVSTLCQIGNMVEDLALLGVNVSDYEERFTGYVQFDIEVDLFKRYSDGAEVRRLKVFGKTVSEILYKNFKVCDQIVYDEGAGDLIREILDDQYVYFNKVIVPEFYNG